MKFGAWLSEHNHTRWQRVWWFWFLVFGFGLVLKFLLWSLVLAYSMYLICSFVFTLSLCHCFSAYPKIPKWQRKNPGERFNAGFFRCLGYNFVICS
ncbi:MAG: hypothetical protein LBT59_20380 [Clostridiales bacterium]|nr:hypothetical protein [Clostridiales bacterium]